MATTMLKRDGQVSEVLLGNLGTKVNLRGYDGAEIDPATNATTSTGNYGLVEQTTHGKHAAFPLAATAVTTAPTPANSAVLIEDTGVLIGAGKAMRLYDAAGTDYAQLASDADGGLVLGGSGANVGILGVTRLRVGDGLVGTPSISFTNDTDTGLYSVSGDRLGITVAGANVVEVANAGGAFGVGIGMTPSVQLDVKRSSTDWVSRIDQTNNASTSKGLQIKSAASAAAATIFEAQSGGTTQFSVNADGSVGGLAWTAFTPTVTQGGAVTVTVATARYRVLGKLAIVQMTLAVTGTGTINTDVAVNVPAAIQSAATGVILGTMMVSDSSAGINYLGAAFAATATAFKSIASGSSNFLGGVGGLFTAALASPDLLWIQLAYETA